MIDENNKVLMDKGWKEMSKVLDAEMPIQINNNRIFYKKLALIIFLLLISLGGGFYMLDNNAKQKKLNQEKIKENRKSQFINNFAKIENNLKESKGLEESSNVRIKHVVSMNIASYNGIAKSVASESTQSIGVSSLVVGKNEHELANRGVDGQYSERKIDDIGLIDDDFLNIKTKNLTDLLAVNRLPLNIEELEKEDFELLYKGSIDSRSYSGIKKYIFNKYFTASLSVVSEDLTSFGGAESGVGYNIDFSNKIGFNAGFSFSFLRKNGMTNSFITNILNVPAYDGSNEKYKVIREGRLGPRYNKEFNISTRNPYTLGGFIDNLYYVGMPVAFYYNSKVFKLSIGLKASYLVKGTNFTANKNYVGGQNYVIYSDKAFFNSKVYNRIDYSTFISFDFAFWKRLSLDMKFNYSFSNILSSPEVQLSADRDHFFTSSIENKYKDRYDNNIYFTLGIKYKL